VPGSEDTLEYYRPEEAAAEFYEVKQLIQEGKTLYYDATEIDEEGLLAGDTYIEDVSGDALVVDTDDLSEYLKVGPNNELYLKGASYTNVIAFYATPMENVAEENRTLQIGAHRKIDSEADSLGIINMFYGSTAEDFGKNVYEISTGTEMYYTIDVDKLGQVDGSYLVIIGTDGSDSDFMDEILALTNLKICGYEIESIESKIKLAYEYGDLMDEAAVRETVGIYLALRPEEEVYEEVYAEEAEETELTESEDIEETEEAEEEVTGPEQVDSAMALIQSIL